MPLYFTEYAHSRMAHAGDSTIVGFLDMFHHRQLSLFYRAWAASQPVATLDPGRSRVEGYGNYVGSLCGLSVPPSTAEDATGDLDKLQFCSLLATRTRHASGLGLLLSQYFGVPVALRHFVGIWLGLPRQERTALRAQAEAPARRRPGVGNPCPGPAEQIPHRHRPRGPGGYAAPAAGDTQPSPLGRMGGPVHRRPAAMGPGAAGQARSRGLHEIDGRARLAYTTWLGRGRAAQQPPMLRIQPRRTINNTR